MRYVFFIIVVSVTGQLLVNVAQVQLAMFTPAVYLIAMRMRLRV